MIIYSIIPLLLMIGLLIIKKVKFQKIINGLFWGIISVIFAVLIGTTILPILGFSTNTGMLITGDGSFSAFMIFLISAALPEEISKLISIKFGSKKEKNSILINAILVGITFACIENIMYIIGYGSNLGLTRMLQPGHLFFQLVMAHMLIKSINKKGLNQILFNVLAVILPVLCHAAFNTFNTINTIAYIFYAIGVLTYVYTFYLILKLKIDKNEYKTKFLVLKIIAILLSIFILLIMYPQNKDNTLNKTQIIEEDNIELKVISSEKVEITDDNFLSGKYIKVKVELKNNNTNTYMLDTYKIRIVDNLNKNDSYLSTFGVDQNITDLEANEIEQGYLYFEDEGYNYTYLIYTAGEFGNTQPYNFVIK